MVAPGRAPALRRRVRAAHIVSEGHGIRARHRGLRTRGRGSGPLFTARNHDFTGNTLVERLYEIVTLAAVELPHHRLLRAAGDPQNAPLAPPVGLGANHL